MKLKRTRGNKVWIGILSFCLAFCVALDCFFLYAFLVQWLTRSEMLGVLPVPILLTWKTWQLLQRRLSISGADKFF